MDIDAFVITFSPHQFDTFLFKVEKAGMMEKEVKWMSAPQDKLAQSRDRLNEAVRKIFEKDDSFTGQITLDIHCKNGIIKDIYKIKTRQKV